MIRLRVPAASFVLDGSTQCREKTDPALVDEYAAARAAGVELPPPDVFAELTEHDALPVGARVWIGDGEHRVRGELKNGAFDILCIVRPGGEEEAFKFALTANRHHGARATPADRRAAIRKALERWPTKSTREIAKLADLGRTLVEEVRKEWAAATGRSDQLREGADGKARRLPLRPEQELAAPAGGPLFPVGLPGGPTYQPILGGAVGEALEGKPLRTVTVTGTATAPGRLAGVDFAVEIRPGDTGEEITGRIAAARTAAPGAVTIVEAAPADSSSFATSNEVEKEEECAPGAAPPPTAEQAPICGSAQIAGSGPADPLAQAEALAAEDEAEEDEAPAPPRRAAAKPEDDYEPGERVALVRAAVRRHKDAPEAERPALAAALRDMAEELAPGGALADALNDDARDRADAAEARVRELEAQLAAARERGDNMEDRWGAARTELDTLRREREMEAGASCGACELAAERIRDLEQQVRRLEAKAERLTEATADLLAGEAPAPAPLRVALIGCGAKKLDRPAAARDLYVGNLFSAALAYAEAEEFDGIFILSAKHGFVHLGQLLEPYDQHIEGLSAAERADLAERVVRDLAAELEGEPAEITVLAAEGYVGLLDGAPWKVHAPLAGLGLLERLDWFKQQREEEPAPATAAAGRTWHEDPATALKVMEVFKGFDHQWTAAGASHKALCTGFVQRGALPAEVGKPCPGCAKRMEEMRGAPPAADPVASPCTRCGAAAGAPCTNYKGQRKPPCKGRGAVALEEPPAGVVKTWGRCYAPGCAREATSVEYLPGLGEKRPVCPGHGGAPAAQTELSYEREPAQPKPARRRSKKGGA